MSHGTRRFLQVLMIVMSWLVQRNNGKPSRNMLTPRAAMYSTYNVNNSVIGRAATQPESRSHEWKCENELERARGHT